MAINARSLTRLSVTVTAEKGDALHVARSRIIIVRTAFIILYSVVALRLFDLMILQTMFLQDDVTSSTIVGMPPSDVGSSVAQSVRSNIVDRNGVLLASSLKVSSLYADPKYIVDPQGTAKALSSLFGDVAYDVLLSKLQKSGRFVWLKRGVTPSDQAAILKIGDPGLGFQSEYRRVYPQGHSLAHVIGYNSIDGAGLMGLERGFDSSLLEGAGVLRSTIDVRVQHALLTEIQVSMSKFSAQGGAGVVMDVHNGEVLGLVSLPDFDPHAPMSFSKDTQFNRAVQGVYELGSVFKIFSIAAFLDLNDGGLSRTFDAREPLKRGRYMIRDFHPEKRVLTVPEVFMVSSNIGTALVAEEIGTKGLKDFYKRLGLLSALDIVLPAGGKPLIPRPWRDINTLTASYGHGIAVSPLHLVSAVSSIVNGGLKISPRFVLPDVEVGDIVSSDRVISEKTSAMMRSLMGMVVSENGTAKKAAVVGMDVGGKTGTAEKPGKNGYDRKRLISSFAGVFPINDPQYAVFVMLDEPKGIKESYGYATAGWTAAPIFSKVVERMVSILSISANHPHDNKNSKKRSVSNIRYKEEF
jgi:cell division protein FtsI (penicillin-binding protein 3)